MCGSCLKHHRKPCVLYWWTDSLYDIMAVFGNLFASLVISLTSLIFNLTTHASFVYSRGFVLTLNDPLCVDGLSTALLVAKAHIKPEYRLMCRDPVICLKICNWSRYSTHSSIGHVLYCSKFQHPWFCFWVMYLVSDSWNTCRPASPLLCSVVMPVS